MRAGGLVAFSAGVIASLAIAASANAATIEVGTNSDDPHGSTSCTLRDAINSAANDTSEGTCTSGAPGTDIITFAPSLTGSEIDLQAGSGGQLEIASDVNIVGPGMGELTISAAPANRVFSTDSGNVITISGMTIRDGNPALASEGIVQGGGIVNLGDLTLTDVRVANNDASALSTLEDVSADGGGIFNAGSLTLDHSRVEGNTASAGFSGGNQSAQARGAGIFSSGPGTSMTIEDSTIAGNAATATNSTAGLALAAGGMYTATPFDVGRSTFSDNTAAATGSMIGTAQATGGILALGSGTSTLELSTVANNQESATAADTIQAGGIRSTAPTLAINSSTLAFNGPVTGTVAGANVRVDAGGTSFANTIISDPRGGGLNCLNLSVIGSTGFNLDFSPAGASCPLGSDTVTSNPALAPGGLASNGGPTETIALQGGSRAIDAGLSTGTTDTTHDQRGLARPVDFSGIPNAAGGNGADIGAFEFQSACPGQATPSTACPGPPPSPAPTQPTSPPTKKKKCKKKGKKAGAAKKKKCKKKKHKK
jgi:hypothetical protein